MVKYPTDKNGVWGRISAPQVVSGERLRKWLCFTNIALLCNCMYICCYIWILDLLMHNVAFNCA